ncbi:ABC transporter substrate-binding protein [Nocardia sp. CDC159]|uniref:ABC transporter substrate-binding protein n=1 Tax=Nocardia pulmonis TaxID=2951408 RepID=A0A9X2EC94_9NOCA|nr:MULTISPECIES: ABC transporter substrate-binding protein [Nocardia]MCM6778214.1 ABC transporter substrate-binding protein [Nocardia pulmonis]MCM6791103.1 ABC transporter substrate-binding protein [Nocardia sp. CDC159]
MLVRLSRVLGLGVVAVAIASCAPVQYPDRNATHTDDFGAPVGTQSVREGGDLVMGLSAEPDRLDPTTSASLYTRYVMNSICEKLYDNDASGKLVPQLATALPTVSPDGLTVTIPVRTGIQFADGTPFDAAAVQTSLQRHLTMKTSQRTSEMGPIAAIEVGGPDRVVLKYKKPFAPITAALADRAGMIMSPAELKKTDKDFGDHPVCVGPFKFVKRVPQTSILVERDPLYYDAKKVHLDTITYRIMPDANIRAANLRSGDIHVGDYMSPQDVDALAKDPGLRLLQSSSLGFQGIYINIGNVDGVGKPAKQIDTPIAKDARIRQALSLSIDRQALVDTVFNNWYEPACTGIVPQSGFATPAGTACPAYDPKRARELLAEAGVQVPYRVKLQVQNQPDQLRYAQALQASVAEGGFELDVQPTEYSTLLDVQKRGTYEAMYFGWSGRLDPDANISRFLTTGSSGNYSGYSSPALDDLLGRAARSSDTAQRAELYGQAAQLIAKDNPYLYTYRIRVLTVHSTRVTGIEAYPDGVVRLGKAAFLTEKD